MAAAEADPAVMAEVGHLRSLRDAIRDVPAPAAIARDTAISAALAEFDRRRHPAPVIRTRPRPSYSRWLAVAAAVAGVAALGAVISQSSRGGDDDDDAAEEAAAVTDLAALDSDDEAGRSIAAGAPAAPATQAAPESGAASATEAPAADSASVLAAEAAPEATAAAATTAAAAGGADAGAAPPAFDPSAPIADEVELGRIGRQLLAELQAGTRVAMGGTACEGRVLDVVFLSDALLIIDGAAHPVLIAGNSESGDTFAVDPETCAVLATGASSP
jgi:hypothetical protein